MKFEYVSGELKSTDPKDVARLMYDFFRFQHERSVECDINARANRSAGIAANAAATDEYQRENSMGWGPRLPYDESRLKQLEENVVAAQKQRAEAKAMLDFVVNKMIDGFVKP